MITISVLLSISSCCKDFRIQRNDYSSNLCNHFRSLGMKITNCPPPSFQAALWDNAELLEDLLNSDQLCHINCQDAWGRTPLHAAATTESSRCLRILLQAGADPNLASGPRAEGRVRLGRGVKCVLQLEIRHG